MSELPDNPFAVWYVSTARIDGGVPDPTKALDDKLYFVEAEAVKAAHNHTVYTTGGKAVAVSAVMTGRRIVA